MDGVINDLDEEAVYISCYANTAPGFIGVLRERYTDFVVNEVDVNENVVSFRKAWEYDEVKQLESEEATRKSLEVSRYHMTHLKKDMGSFSIE